MANSAMGFLGQFDCKVKRDGAGRSLSTHTCMNGGSYCVPKERLNELYDLIAEDLEKGVRLYITERVDEVSLIRVDIDLKYDGNGVERQHDDRHIMALAEVYDGAIKGVLKVPSDQILSAYVFQRRNPYDSEGITKDGIHIMYPDVICDSTSRLAIRKKALEGIGSFLKNTKLCPLPVTNTDENVVDAAVVKGGSWLLTGCRKPGREPYNLHCVIGTGTGGASIMTISECSYRELIKMTSNSSEGTVYEPKAVRLVSHQSPS